MRISPSLEMLHGKGQRPNVAARDAAGRVGKVAGLRNPELRTSGQCGKVRQMFAPGLAAFAACDLIPVESERATVGIAAVLEERAGGGTGGAAASGDGHAVANLGIIAVFCQVEA